MRQDRKETKKYYGLIRRLLVGAVIFPSFVALTSIDQDETNKPQRKMHRVGERIVTPGSQSYLDLNPSF